jgi:uncharacterized protein
MAHPVATAADVEALRAAYDALNRGDVEGTLAPLAEDAEWHESAELPDSDTYRGRDTIRDFLSGFLESWDRFSQQIEEVVVTDERVCLLIHLEARGRESGAGVDARYAHVWTLRDGLGVRVDAYYDRDAALRALAGPSG